MAATGIAAILFGTVRFMDFLQTGVLHLARQYTTGWQAVVVFTGVVLAGIGLIIFGVRGIYLASRVSSKSNTTVESDARNGGARGSP